MASEESRAAVPEPGPVPLSSGPAGKKAAPRPQKFLPTDRLSFPKQLELLRSYGVLYDSRGQPVTPAEAGVGVALKESTANLANAFFQESGFLVKSAAGFTPAEDVVAYARAFTWDESTAAHKLRPLVESTWFGLALMPRLRMGAKDESQAVQILAEAAVAAPDFKGQLRTLLDYLQAVGLVERDGALIRAARLTQGSAAPLPAVPDAPTEPPPPPKKDGKMESSFTQDAQVMRFSVSIDISMSEIGRWAPERISAFFSGVAQVMAAKAGIEKGGGGE